MLTKEAVNFKLKDFSKEPSVLIWVPVNNELMIITNVGATRVYQFKDGKITELHCADPIGECNGIISNAVYQRLNKEYGYVPEFTPLANARAADLPQVMLQYV